MDDTYVESELNGVVVAQRMIPESSRFVSPVDMRQSRMKTVHSDPRQADDSLPSENFSAIDESMSLRPNAIVFSVVNVDEEKKD